MIQKYDIIKHRDSMDVAFEVVSASSDDTHLILSGMWWNQGANRSWLLPVPLVDIRIRREHVGNWLKLSLPRADERCLRHCDWIPYAG
jgi:hypothetical protein